MAPEKWDPAALVALGRLATTAQGARFAWMRARRRGGELRTPDAAHPLLARDGSTDLHVFQQVFVARVAATVIGILSIILAITLRTLNVAFLVGLAFAVAASANVPAILLTLYWRRFTTQGMVIGMVVGLLASVLLIVLSPAVMGIDAPAAATRHLIQAEPIFPLDNPAIVSAPLGFLAAVIGSLLTRARTDAYDELHVRANTGLGAV